jgi:hypothetical protein
MDGRIGKKFGKRAEKAIYSPEFFFQLPYISFREGTERNFECAKSNPNNCKHLLCIRIDRTAARML